MEHKYEKNSRENNPKATSLFIFHRDLHIQDNLGLIDCLTNSQIVYLVFIFTPQQIDKNTYFSERSFTFMLGALKELSNTAKISFFYEEQGACIERLIKELDITDVWENKDFSPFAKSREDKSARICKRNKINYHSADDITLLPMGAFLTAKETCYLKYTPFYKNAKRAKIPEPRSAARLLHKVNKKALRREIKLTEFDYKFAENGRAEALKLIRRFNKIESRYNKERDFPHIDATSHLGPHLHFCTISPREVYWLVKSAAFRAQLYWREFYMYIVNYVSVDYSKKAVTLPKMNKIKWATNKTELKKWQHGKTGVPIVDAGMRELLQTGYMHNRLRMITAMYLIFYLRIHWKEGEKWFAQHLADYSYANNYGGWVWCAGIETHSNPYFRVFSMEEQNRRFDVDCVYIKHWVAELRDLTPKEIFAKYAGLKEIRQDSIAEIKHYIR